MFDNHMNIRRIISTLVLGLVIIAGFSGQAVAQNLFAEPQFEKVTEAERDDFQQRFGDVKWTGRGLYQKTVIDDISTHELRARLQSAFGDPTQTIEDLVNQENFRPAKAIQFEYWFVIDDKYPLMVLDVDGPFSVGLVYGGASKYIDLMPQVKRAFAKRLMEVENLGEFQDYFYSPETEKWYDVTYKNGEFGDKVIDTPKGLKIRYDY